MDAHRFNARFRRDFVIVAVVGGVGMTLIAAGITDAIAGRTAAAIVAAVGVAYTGVFAMWAHRNLMRP